MALLADIMMMNITVTSNLKCLAPPTVLDRTLMRASFSGGHTELAVTLAAGALRLAAEKPSILVKFTLELLLCTSTHAAPRSTAASPCSWGTPPGPRCRLQCDHGHTTTQPSIASALGCRQEKNAKIAL
jgi:hypothetical protein